MKAYAVPLVAAFILTGCTHQATVGTASPTNISSNYDTKISLPIVYTIDSMALTKLRRNGAVHGVRCRAHHYPVDGTEAFTGSVPPMMEAVFDNFHQSAPSPQKGITQLVFRIERFDPSVIFHEKYLGVDAHAKVELELSIFGIRDGTRVFGTTVETQRSTSGEVTTLCSGAGEVLADATRDAIKNVLEKAGERLANNPQLRLRASQ